MQLADSILIRKMLLVIKSIYWMWLILCFVHWFLLALATLIGPDEMKYHYKTFSSLFRFAFNNKLGSVLFISPFYISIFFTIISIVRRKISTWEFCFITLIWCLMFYVFSHLHG